jgi:hypothetical protein
MNAKPCNNTMHGKFNSSRAIQTIRRRTRKKWWQQSSGLSCNNMQQPCFDEPSGGDGHGYTTYTTWMCILVSQVALEVLLVAAADYAPVLCACWKLPVQQCLRSGIFTDCASISTETLNVQQSPEKSPTVLSSSLQLLLVMENANTPASLSS